MAEIVVTAFIEVLVKKLASVDFIKLARSAGIYSELDKWKSTLVQIQDVLVDADQKRIKKISVQKWLHKLQHLAYEINDLLDNLATEAMNRQMIKGSSASTSTSTRTNNKVFKNILNLATFTPSNIMYGYTMSSKLEVISTRLHCLVKEKKRFDLNDNVESSNKTYTRSDETSLVGEVKIVGREGDKEALLWKLLGINEPRNKDVSVVSIVGMGGLGKTTLARDLYNEKKVKDHFQLMSWVCVSEEFNVFNISKAIFIDVGGKDRHFVNLNQLHEALKEKLSQKRFLLVLDDVWNENYREWELLQRPFLVGASGSKIIVTTQKLKVASVMDSVESHLLMALSNEAALSLLAQHALSEQNFDKHPTLKLHGVGIVKKCGRLPLALMTLGRVLRTKKKEEEEWVKLLNNETWNLSDDILPALRLSYYDLPTHLKQLFAYCCLFPKDYMFKKDELVLLWMAEGFLPESNANKLMENFGLEYFEELKSRSFFQQYESGYTMYDLIHDLTTSVGGEFFCMLDDKTGNEDLKNVHHLSFIRKRFGVYREFVKLQGAIQLRTLSSVSVSDRRQSSNTVLRSFFLSNKVLSELLPKLKFLRVVSLTDYSIEEVPDTIGKLQRMRYLNFSRTDITCLPDQIGDLYNLQSLLVSGCRRLSSLPNSFAKLINLRHLDISDTPLLNKTPLWIGGLKSLKTLSKVIIEGADGFKISELRGLSDLRGQLVIEGLEKVIDSTQAKDANLQQKKDLVDLELKWSDAFEDSRDKEIEYEVLEGLRPHRYLRTLNISFYWGIEFPSWVGDSSFQRLTELRLRGCRSCTCLPTLGHLQSLKKLYVSSMNGVKTVGMELLAATNSFHGIAFRSLEVLKFDDMQGWEKWSTSGGDDNGSFPCLREISIVNCPKLVDVSVVLIQSLRVLHIEGCCEKVVRSMVGVSPSIRELKLKKIIGLTQLHRDILIHLWEVEYLFIESCDELKYLWESKLEFLVSLRNLEVWNCESLESYSSPNNIERLVIQGCPLITSFTFPSTLKFLHITSCENLMESRLRNSFLPSLESLIIQHYHKLRSFRERWVVHLTSLDIWDCDNIVSIPERGFGFDNLFCLRRLKIFRCKNLKSFPHKHLQHLKFMEELEIRNCPNIDNSFPRGVVWPPNLRILRIGCLNKAMSEWGRQNYPTSLVQLHLLEDGENSGVVSFAEAEKQDHATSSSTFILPASLLSLQLLCFGNLKSLSKGLQHLIYLQELTIEYCNKLTDLPEKLLPSLSSLTVRCCSELECGRGEGKYWRIIRQIPHLRLDYDDSYNDSAWTIPN